MRSSHVPCSVGTDVQVVGDVIEVDRVVGSRGGGREAMTGMVAFDDIPDDGVCTGSR